MQVYTDGTVTTTMLAAYINHLKEEEKSAATVEKYTRDVEKFIVFAGSRPMTKELAIAFKEELKQTYQVGSINSMLAALNNFFAFLGLNHCQVKRLRVQRSAFCDQEKELSKEEYRRLIETSHQKGQEQINLIIQTICGTGIRVSELPYITVEAVKQRRAVVECKSKVRVVLISKQLQKILLPYIHSQGLESGPVFITRKGKPIHRSTVWKAMKALCAAARVSHKKVFPHNLRHLFARTFYGMEKDIAKLADILGHSNIETTRGYIISSGKEHSRQIDRLGLVT